EWNGQYPRHRPASAVRADDHGGAVVDALWVVPLENGEMRTELRAAPSTSHPPHQVRGRHLPPLLRNGGGKVSTKFVAPFSSPMREAHGGRWQRQATKS